MIPLACSLFNIPNDIAMQVVGVGFIIGVIQDQEFAKKLAESNAHEAYELLAPRFAE